MTARYSVVSVDLPSLSIGLRAEDEEACMALGKKVGKAVEVAPVKPYINWEASCESIAESLVEHERELQWAHATISELMTAGRGRALELERALYHLLAWTNSGQCPDCDPFREAPSEPDWQHAHDCGLLETANEARASIGLEPETGHHIPDAPAEMLRLAGERTVSVWKELRAERDDLRTQLDAANSKSASLANDLKLVMEHRNNLWRDLDAANARIAELEKGEDEALERLDILEDECNSTIDKHRRALEPGGEEAGR